MKSLPSAGYLKMKFKQYGIHLAALICFLQICGTLSGNESDTETELGVRVMIWNDGASLAELYGVEEGTVAPEGHELHLWTGGERSEPLLVPFSSLSSPLKLNKREGRLVFLKKPFNAADPEGIPPVAAHVNIPPHITEAILLMVPTDLANNEYGVVVIDNSYEYFPPNTLRVINLSQERLGLAFAGETKLVEAGGEVRFSTAGIQRRIEIFIVGRQSEAGDRIHYQSQRIRITAGARVTSFLVPPGTGDRLQMTSIVDLPR